MMPGWVQSKQLVIDGMRQPGQGMPIGLLGGPKGPLQRLPAEPRVYLGVVDDVMVIIGSRKSANTKRLFEISRSLNKKSYWVTSEKDIKKDWFRKADNVGVISGASTPDETTQKIISSIRSLS